MRMRPGAACLLLLAACSDPPLEVEFAETPLTVAEKAAWSRAGVRSAHQEITVRRTITTPSWCRDLEADAIRTGSDVTLRVKASETQDECPPGEGLWGYVAEIRGLKRGRYNLRVIHTFADPRRPSEVVLAHPILVE
jgi:hypothetical protein